MSEEKKNSLISKVPVFSWKDLNNKTIKILCYEEECGIVVGYDESSGVMYILDTELKDA